MGRGVVVDEQLRDGRLPPLANAKQPARLRFVERQDVERLARLTAEPEDRKRAGLG